MSIYIYNVIIIIVIIVVVVVVVVAISMQLRLWASIEPSSRASSIPPYPFRLCNYYSYRHTIIIIIIINNNNNNNSSSCYDYLYNASNRSSSDSGGGREDLRRLLRPYREGISLREIQVPCRTTVGCLINMNA